MGAPGSRLAVHIGETDTVAAIDVDGRRIPVLFPGGVTIPSQVSMPRQDEAAPSQSMQPMAALAAPGGQHDQDGVAALATLLSAITGHACTGHIEELYLTAPAGWGPRRRALLRDAARQAGLPDPVIVAEPVAAAAHSNTSTPVEVDACVLVCHIGQDSCNVAVVQRAEAGWEVLASIDVAAVSGRQLDQRLAALLITAHQMQTDDAVEAVAAAVAAARAQLQVAGRAAIAMPAPHPPALLTADDLTTVVNQMCEAIHAAAIEAVQAADIDPEQLTGVIAYGSAASDIPAATLIEPHFGLTHSSGQISQHALAYGALAGGPTHATGTLMTAGRRILRLGYLAAIILPFLAGAALTWQAITELRYFLPKRLTYTPYDYADMNHYFNASSYTLGGLLFAMSAIAAGRLFAAALHETSTDKRDARRAGHVLAFGAAIGLAIAGLQGLFAQAFFGGPTQAGSPQFLNIAVAAAIVPVTVCIVVGLLAPFAPRLTEHPWPRHLHYPAIPVTLAGLGALGMDVGQSWILFDHRIAATTIVGRIGAALIGIAIAWTLVPNRVGRTVLAAVLGIGCALVYGLPTASLITTTYILVTCLWWLLQAGKIGWTALPSAPKSRLARIFR